MGAGRITISPTTGTASPQQTESKNRRKELEFIVLGKPAESLDPKALTRLSSYYHGALDAAGRRGTDRRVRDEVESTFHDIATGRIKNDYVQLGSKRIKDAVEQVKPEHLQDFLSEMHAEMIADPKRADAIPEAMLSNYQLTGGRVRAKSLVKMARAGFRKSGSDCPKEASEAAKHEFEAGRLDSIEGVSMARLCMRFPDIAKTLDMAPSVDAGRTSEMSATLDSGKTPRADPKNSDQASAQISTDAANSGMHPAAIWTADIDVDKRSSKTNDLSITSGSRRMDPADIKECQTLSLDGGKNQEGIRPRFSLKALALPAWLALRLEPKEQRRKEADDASEEKRTGGDKKPVLRKILPPLEMAIRSGSAGGKNARGPADEELGGPQIKPLVFEDGFELIKTPKPKGPSEMSSRRNAAPAASARADNAKMRETAKRFKMKTEGLMKNPKRKKPEKGSKPEARGKRADKKTERKGETKMAPPRPEKKTGRGSAPKKRAMAPLAKEGASPMKAKLAEKAPRAKKDVRKKPAPKAERQSAPIGKRRGKVRTGPRENRKDEEKRRAVPRAGSEAQKPRKKRANRF